MTDEQRQTDDDRIALLAAEVRKLGASIAGLEEKMGLLVEQRASDRRVSIAVTRIAISGAAASFRALDEMRSLLVAAGKDPGSIDILMEGVRSAMNGLSTLVSGKSNEA